MVTTLPVRHPVRHRPRRALVLGAGGVLGAAWMTGALSAAEDLLQAPLGDVDLMLGTSAGSVLVAALRCGVSIEEMVAHQRGEPIGALAEVGDVNGGPWPRPPRLKFGSPRLMASALRAPHRIHPTVSASAWLPVGRESHVGLHAMVHLLHSRAASCATAPHWVERGQTWVVAVDYDTGERVVFGRPGAPTAGLADAVIASCSVPGWYEPVLIDGRRYVDGGVRSATSLGLIARERIDEVCVLAPMASLVADRRYAPHLRIERRVRQLFTFALLRDVKALRAAGIKVTVLTPGPEDLAVIGVNLMDPRRRQAVLETSLRTSPRAYLTSAA
ncbi:MAG TPA: patatin-like phospholipase family protein [Streptosporangiaceae bacterium]|nr:patatin-like phospholipase family protein [Streptosporangiaceae bacterium]